MVTGAGSAATAVLGSILVDPRCVPELMTILSPEDFPDSLHRRIFEAVSELYLARSPIDPVLVLDRLGSESYRDTLAKLMQATPTAAHAGEYARILRDQHSLTEIQAACMEICASGVDLARARELLAQAAALLVDRPDDRDKSYTDLLHDLLDRQADRTPPDWLDWGIPALNARLMIGPGRFVIIGADSSVGKTALALQFALSIARAGKRVGFFSYETSLEDATDRAAANDASLVLRRIKSKQLGREEFARVADAGGRSEKLQLRIIESARFTVADIRAKTLARQFQVIFVDYLQLVPTRQKERYEAVTEISMELHRMAQELGVTVVGLSQVTVPEAPKKGPRRYITKDDLRESRQLKQDADAILLLDLSNPEDWDSNRVLIIDKNKDDARGRVVLAFDPKYMRFTYVPPVEGTDAKASRERVEAMDRNREKRLQEEAARGKTQIDGQGSFADLEDDAGGPLPFET